ncbi:exonuclease 1, putative [Theileria annulata]|uniref:Exonuclease 1 n=1 Tax=Theileria annulata TaxID=5874 RepID=Q4UAE8_THEAN|nr:exonuclease 1, putative [Theileria annulata]CAI76203.1 exonuclease 1, putative [Theileria annulata]|eukprot:XP_952828.1 exonuclease 1, putative [Theileria annulata]
MINNIYYYTNYNINYYQPYYNNFNTNTYNLTNNFTNNNTNTTNFTYNNTYNNFTNNFITNNISRNRYNEIKYRKICNVCNIYFNNEKQLLDHINDLHINCNYENCNFNGPINILEIHKLKHIKNKEGNTIDSKDEIKKWINSRIKNFPKSNESNIISNKKRNYRSNNNINNGIVDGMVDGIGDGIGNGTSMDGISNGIVNKMLECEEMSILEKYLRNKMNKYKRNKKSIVFPYINKIYKQPSALIRYTNPIKYEQMLKRLETIKSPYSYKSSICEKYKNGIKYSIPIRPPTILQLIRGDIEKLDKSVVNIIKYIQHLKSNEKNVNIKKYSGCVAAIDAMCWIHRGLISSAVANVRNEICDKYMKFIISMLQLLIKLNITPIMVFDGYEMPAKKNENMMRRERRNKARSEAMEMIHKNKGKINTEIMRKCMQAIQITPEIVHRVITICKKINVTVVVSPYEADAQISYLCRTGVADFAISEDSDLIVYGCPKIIYKLNKEGKGVELNIPFFNKQNKLVHLPKKISTTNTQGNTQNTSTPINTPGNTHLNTHVSTQNVGTNNLQCDKMEFGDTNKSNEVDFVDIPYDLDGNMLKVVDYEKFIMICILSGTDYDDKYHIGGIGIKVACKLMLQYKTIETLLQYLVGNNKYKLPDNVQCREILSHYKNIYNIFLYNVVYNPSDNALVHINNKVEPEDPNGYYSYLNDMILNLREKEVNFIKIAQGVVSVHDHHEISYSLTEADLNMVESLKNTLILKLYKFELTFATKFSLLNIAHENRIDSFKSKLEPITEFKSKLEPVTEFKSKLEPIPEVKEYKFQPKNIKSNQLNNNLQVKNETSPVKCKVEEKRAKRKNITKLLNNTEKYVVKRKRK